MFLKINGTSKGNENTVILMNVTEETCRLHKIEKFYKTREIKCFHQQVKSEKHHLRKPIKMAIPILRKIAMSKRIMCPILLDHGGCQRRRTLINQNTPKFGPKIHDKLAQLWQKILRKGLGKEAKDKLVKSYLISKNRSLLQAPKMNPEISAAVSDVSRRRDKKIKAVQQQLGQGISALTKGLELLLDDGNKLQAISFLSNSCRLLCDLCPSFPTLHKTWNEMR
ncbi:PREDICTED: uncharacterized protein LOC106122742 [Papilio xuthus]|uniref:Uncharacterized protein LOC106122742 n=1 Tax=Papilio xuthus TaxID=66420 RepID=A0AAJ7EEL1_PAPXU|nr:PREDICTED: uncharacterized protein LOC106122742 [Papilio xuthus]